MGAELRAGCCLCLGWGRGPGGREVAVLHNSTFQFLNAGHSLTEISSRRLSLANYWLQSPPLALLARSGQTRSLQTKTLFTSAHLCCVWKVGPFWVICGIDLWMGHFHYVDPFELCNLQTTHIYTHFVII